MSRSKNTPPSLRHHKYSGQAVVTLSGHDIYLGPFGTQLSRDNYDRHVGEWLASGRTMLQKDIGAGLAVAQLANAFHQAVRPTRDDYRAVIRLWVRLYGRTMMSDFGPLALKAVREQMIAAGWKRQTINERVNYLRTIVRWGVENEIISATILHALQAVKGLRQGDSNAPESKQV